MSQLNLYTILYEIHETDLLNILNYFLVNDIVNGTE